MGECENCKGRLWVCENHPDKAFEEECACGAGMPCSCNPEAILGPGSTVLVDEAGGVDGNVALAMIDALRARVTSLEDATRYGEKVCAELVSERDAARAREREAVERAEKVEHNWHWVFETLGIPKEADESLDLDKAEPILSALAAARKALEEIAGFILEHPFAAKGMGTGPHTQWETLQKMARAALKGDGHD